MSNKPSAAWYLAPIFFGIVGSAIMWYVLKDDDHPDSPKMIRKGWIIGIVLTVIDFAWIPFVLLCFWRLCSKDFEEIRKKTINEGIKPQVLKKLLNDCKIYKINKGSKSIVIKKEIIHFMNKNKKLLESALNHMIARYLENCNVSPNISTKLEEKIPRKKLKTQEFNEIVSLQKSRCFYCEKKFDSFAQEHFLPWNWVWQTENFNMVPACRDCNSSKHDKLPEEKFLKKLLERNKKLDNLPIGYSDKFLETQYENCRTGYHGIDEDLWNK